MMKSYFFVIPAKALHRLAYRTKANPFDSKFFGLIRTAVMRRVDVNKIDLTPRRVPSILRL